MVDTYDRESLSFKERERDSQLAPARGRARYGPPRSGAPLGHSPGNRCSRTPGLSVLAIFDGNPIPGSRPFAKRPSRPAGCRFRPGHPGFRDSRQPATFPEGRTGLLGPFPETRSRLRDPARCIRPSGRCSRQASGQRCRPTSPGPPPRTGERPSRPHPLRQPRFPAPPVKLVKNFAGLPGPGADPRCEI